MMKGTLASLLAVHLLTLTACGTSGDGGGDLGPDAAVPQPDSSVGATGDAPSCEPPDLLIVLDRTQSMFRTPANTIPANTVAGRASSKWGLAVKAVEQVTAALDGTVRFGLELFPLNPGGTQCVTLEEKIGGTNATNATCQAGEVPVPPSVSTASAINAAIDIETTRLCNSTPITAALGTAAMQLSQIAVTGREQHVLLLTDGKNGCSDDASVTQAVQQLAAANVTTYVVGFGTGGTDGVDNAQLNNLACAGHTSKGFPAGCTQDASGNYTATDPAGAALYYDAQDGTALSTALSLIGGDVCCGCLL
jgi:hypothetical protein